MAWIFRGALSACHGPKEGMAKMDITTAHKRGGPRSWSSIALIGVVAAVTLAGSAVAAGGAGEFGLTAPSTTIPSDGDTERPVEDPREAPEVLGAAEDLGISVDEVIDLFTMESEHIAFATSLVDHPGFVDFRGPHAEGGSLLVVEPGFEADAAFRNPPEGLTIQASAIQAAKRDMALREAEDAAMDVAGPAFWAVDYDVFDNAYRVWVKPGTLTAELGAAISTQTPPRLTNNPEATVVAEETEEATPAWGGLSILRNAVYQCTSAFGVVDWPTASGYLTAGHCPVVDNPTGQWSVNGNVAGQPEFADTLNPGPNLIYDRSVMLASGASWLVQIDWGRHEDLESTPEILFVGTYVSHFGNIGGHDDGTVYDYHRPPGVPNFVYRGSGDCMGGDSGGPGYRYDPPTGKRYPKAIISAVHGNEDCGYVSLLTQLAGTGWTLL